MAPDRDQKDRTLPSGAERRPGLDHPVRKALYVLSGATRELDKAALDIEALIADLRLPDCDVETWDAVVQLRRDLRVTQMQRNYAMQAAQNWSRKAARDAT